MIVVGFLQDLHLKLINTIKMFRALARFYDHIHSFIITFSHSTQTMHEGVHYVIQLLQVLDQPPVLVGEHADFPLDFGHTMLEVVDIIKFDSYSER